MTYNKTMPRKVSFAVGEFYHVYNRGVDKRIVFNDKQDYCRFMALLYLANTKEGVKVSNITQSFNLESVFVKKEKEFLVEIGAYCLMPNHFHLLIKERIERGLSTFMQKLSTAYTMYFNKRNERSGALFQGVFKAEHVKEDRYLKYLLSYIHLNPIKLIDPIWKERKVFDLRKTKNFLEKYEYSSYLDYKGKGRPYSHIIERAGFPNYFMENRGFDEFIDFWILFQKSNQARRNLA